jgi:hypothetical protein
MQVLVLVTKPEEGTAQELHIRIWDFQAKHINYELHHMGQETYFGGTHLAGANKLYGKENESTMHGSTGANYLGP